MQSAFFTLGRTLYVEYRRPVVWAHPASPHRWQQILDIVKTLLKGFLFIYLFVYFKPCLWWYYQHLSLLMQGGRSQRVQDSGQIDVSHTPWCVKSWGILPILKQNQTALLLVSPGHNWVESQHIKIFQMEDIFTAFLRKLLCVFLWVTMKTSSIREATTVWSFL